MNANRNAPLITARTARTAIASALAGTLVLLAACATTPPPTEQMAVAKAALAHAVAAGGVESAPAEVALARDKLARADKAMAAQDYGTAMTLSQQAQLDAQLAEAKTDSAKAEKSAMALQEASRVLRDEMARKKP